MGKMSRDKGRRYADVKGYEGLYKVSDMGEVISLPRNNTKGGVLKPYVSPHNGYCYVSLSKGNKRACKRVHCLVMMAFNPVPKTEGLEIDHKDKNKENNRLDNLEWVTHTENIHRRGKINYHTVPVIDLDTGVIFESELLAAQSVGGKSSSSIHRVCNGKRNHYKGHRFAFYRENKMVNSKQKGKRYELELASVFREYGYDARRTAQYCGNTGDASDVVGLPGIHIEAKRQEVVKIYDWMSQAIHDSAKSGNKPAVFFRKSNHETLVCMRLEDWIEIYREWEAGQ